MPPIAGHLLTVALVYTCKVMYCYNSRLRIIMTDSLIVTAIIRAARYTIEPHTVSYVPNTVEPYTLENYTFSYVPNTVKLKPISPIPSVWIKNYGSYLLIDLRKNASILLYVVISTVVVISGVAIFYVVTKSVVYLIRKRKNKLNT